MVSQPAVLVIDDDRNFCRILEVKLRRSAFDVTLVHDAASAFDALMEREYDLVLLDLRLPDADGLAVLPRLKAASGAAPILVITAYEEDQLRSRARSAGAVDVLFKPFDLDLLVQTVRRTIECSSRLSAVASGQVIHLSRVGAEPGQWVARVTACGEDAFSVLVEQPSGLDPQPGMALQVALTGADGIYAFRSRVRRIAADGSFELTKPGVIRRVQRRKHRRAPLYGEVELRTPAGETVRAMARDVSVGGLGLVVERAVTVGEVIEASWQLPSAAARATLVGVAAAVVRCEALWAEGDAAVCRVGLEFRDTAPRTRRRIAAYIAAQE